MILRVFLYRNTLIVATQHYLEKILRTLDTVPFSEVLFVYVVKRVSKRFLSITTARALISDSGISLGIKTVWIKFVLTKKAKYTVTLQITKKTIRFTWESNLRPNGIAENAILFCLIENFIKLFRSNMFLSEYPSALFHLQWEI